MTWNSLLLNVSDLNSNMLFNSNKLSKMCDAVIIK